MEREPRSPRRLPGVIPGLHRLADNVATGALRTPILYPDGFGSLAKIDRIVRQIRDYESRVQAPRIALTFGPAKPFGRGTARYGTFRSPTLHIGLPYESETAQVELILPLDAPPRRTPIVLHLAASGEMTFFARRQLARALLRDGIASLILENPFYGSRKPAGQKLAALRTVSDQFAMNFATVEEGRALLRHLHGEGFRDIAVTGYSQGGVMAAFCAALSDFPVAVAARGAANSVADLFTRDNFSQIVLWDRLAEDVGDEAKARRRLAEALKVVTVSHFPPPVRPEAAVILAGRHDRFIAPEQAQALHAHWPGSELRWLDAGHVTALVKIRSHLLSIRSALGRLRPSARAGIL